MATKGLRNIFRLRVVHLPWTVGDSQLKQYFSQFGQVVNATVIFDRSTGLSKQTAILEVADKKFHQTLISREIFQLEGSEIFCRNWSEQ